MVAFSSSYPTGAPLPRIKTDNASTGFTVGREFRFFYELNIPNAESVWVKVVVGTDSILRYQTLTADTGAIRFRAWRDATEVGPFSAPSSPTSGWFNRNPAAQAEFSYVGQNAVTIGGDGAATVVGATCSEVIRVRTSGSTAQRTSVGGDATQERGVSAGTYYLQLENIAGSGAAEGVYTFVLEELE